MKKILKWFLVGLGTMLGLVLLSLAGSHLYMGYRFGKVHDVEGSDIQVPTDPSAVAAGERLARLRGCMGGCHGAATEGSVFFALPDGSRVVAPDLGRIAAEYSTADLERVIRHGIRPGGTSVQGIMPSAMLAGLGDGDLASILAFLRSRPPGDEDLPDAYAGPLLRAMLLFYMVRYDWGVFAAEEIQHDAPRLDPASADPLERGRYLATTICSECHGGDLQGMPDGSIPNLAIAAAYSREDFGTLMRTGVPIGNRDLGLMKEVSLRRFAHFTEPEDDDLHTYLQTLAGTN